MQAGRCATTRWAWRGPRTPATVLRGVKRGKLTGYTAYAERCLYLNRLFVTTLMPTSDSAYDLLALPTALVLTSHSGDRYRSRWDDRQLQHQLQHSRTTLHADLCEHLLGKLKFAGYLLSINISGVGTQDGLIMSASSP